MQIDKIIEELKIGLDYLEESDKLHDDPTRRVNISISIPLKLKIKLSQLKQNKSRLIEKAIEKELAQLQI